MKNTFAVTMTLLLALTLGGSIAGYRIATTPHHAEEEAAKGGAESIGDPTVQDVKSEDAPSAQSAATAGVGADEDGVPQGDARPDQLGGSTSGENGAVAADGTQESGGAEESEGGDLGGGNGDGLNEESSQGGADGEQGEGTSTERTSAEGASPEGDEPAQGSAADAPVPSPTVQDSGTEVGQTGASNVEKSSAGTSRLSDEKAAEVADTLGGDSEGEPGQDSRAEQLDETNDTPSAPSTR